MDFAYLHLMLNHVPVFAVVFGFIILLGGVLARSKVVTGVGLGLLALGAIAAIPVYLTGEAAEETIENLPGVSESITSQHESAAFFSLGLAILSGVFAIASLLLTRSLWAKLSGYVVVATLLMSFLTGISMIRTANLGGQIRHTEIRSGAQNADPNTETGTKEKGKSGKDDDD